MAITSWPSYNPRNPFYTPGAGYGNPGGSAWRDDPLNIGYQVGEQNNAAHADQRFCSPL